MLELIEIPRQRYDAEAGKDELDPVTAFLQDFEPGRGQLTLICWGRAWSHYWGAMGNGSTLRKFLSGASTGYLVGKLMLPYDVMLKRAERREERWLSQIIEALKAQLARGMEARSGETACGLDHEGATARSASADAHKDTDGPSNAPQVEVKP